MVLISILVAAGVVILIVVAARSTERAWMHKHPYHAIHRRLQGILYDTPDNPIRGTSLPAQIQLPRFVKRIGDTPGSISFSKGFFRYWLCLSPTVVGFLLTGIKSGSLYSERSIRREGKLPRKICAPSPSLKSAQRRILRRYLGRIETHDAAHGFVTGRSIFTAAAPHVGKRVVVSLDIRDFFGTITYRRVRGLFQAYGLEKNEAIKLAGLCCYKGVAPQGAPTSPMISNLVCRRLDARLSGLAATKGFAYTRYADDLLFSGDSSILKYVSIFQKIVVDEGFTIAPEKVRIKRSGGRQRILSLNVNTKLSVPRKVRKLVRAMVHRAANHQRPDAQTLSFIQGYISFIAGTHRNKARVLKRKLRKAC